MQRKMFSIGCGVRSTMLPEEFDLHDDIVIKPTGEEKALEIKLCIARWWLKDNKDKLSFEDALKMQHEIEEMRLEKLRLFKKHYGRQLSVSTINTINLAMGLLERSLGLRKDLRGVFDREEDRQLGLNKNIDKPTAIEQSENEKCSIAPLHQVVDEKSVITEVPHIENNAIQVAEIKAEERLAKEREKELSNYGIVWGIAFSLLFFLPVLRKSEFLKGDWNLIATVFGLVAFIYAGRWLFKGCANTVLIIIKKGIIWGGILACVPCLIWCIYQIVVLFLAMLPNILLTMSTLLFIVAIVVAIYWFVRFVDFSVRVMVDVLCGKKKVLGDKYEDICAIITIIVLLFTVVFFAIFSKTVREIVFILCVVFTFAVNASIMWCIYKGFHLTGWLRNKIKAPHYVVLNFFRRLFLIIFAISVVVMPFVLFPYVLNWIGVFIKYLRRG